MAIKDGKIVAIGKLPVDKATTVLNVKGLIIAPGFIDVHTHIEGNSLTVPTAENFIFDGVTSVVTGNCGSSNTDVARYFEQLDSVKTSINIATLNRTQYCTKNRDGRQSTRSLSRGTKEYGRTCWHSHERGCGWFFDRSHLCTWYFFQNAGGNWIGKSRCANTTVCMHPTSAMKVIMLRSN